MLSAATTTAGLSGWSRRVCEASRSSGTALAQPTLVMWYLSSDGSIPKCSAKRWASVGTPREKRVAVMRVPISAGSTPSPLDRADRMTEEFLLDQGGASLQRQSLVVALEVQMPPFHARAREDPLGELVARETEPLQDVVLGVGLGGVGDCESRDPRSGPVSQARPGVRAR